MLAAATVQLISVVIPQPESELGWCHESQHMRIIQRELIAISNKSSVLTILEYTRLYTG